MWRDLAAALALMLVLEGILPFLNPSGLRRALALLGDLSDVQLRIAGFSSMLIGLLALYWVRG
ncbi:membrane protein [Sulfurifustis variabilis]|uniref:Membrane protein n=1 Tax=Sulfurifustis variabilis TaxID=1675686 RepID=A0A1B4VDP3_9GAMM|nr:DUF2065 domain-containing protein [Sulfurifustis variabilis]BAU48477.1 membrane protein [Sulfurifustis variabilis]